MRWLNRAADLKLRTLQIHELDVHESVHRDTIMKMTNKMHSIG
jgi:hypothetical protein